MNCPNCGSDDREYVYITDLPGPDVEHWICNQCGCEYDDDGDILGWQSTEQELDYLDELDDE